MNHAKAKADFKRAVHALLAAYERINRPGGPLPFQGADVNPPLEHSTREDFLDGFIEALGWTLGAAGDVVEEARIKADTTTYMDYLGVSADERYPVLIIEAKAWGMPFVASRRGSGVGGVESVELIIRTIMHVRNGGGSASSPAIKLWHEYIEQVHGYVRDLKEQYSHDVARVLLSSGQWLVIFVRPVVSFLGDAAVESDDIVIVHKNEYVARSSEIFELLGRHRLADSPPKTLRPAQLKSYVSAVDVVALYHAMVIKFESSGSSRFTPRPLVLAYPAVLVQRTDGVLLTVLGQEEGIALDSRDTSGHLDEVDDAANALIAVCCDELGVNIDAAGVDRFPGFPQKASAALSEGSAFVGDVDEVPDEWLLVTGTEAHYLRRTPAVDACRFHSWAACSGIGKGVGRSALAARSVANPRAFFVDEEDHHCAHQDVLDWREVRCHIEPIDERLCCQACVYLNVCWSNDEAARLPCG